jgi:adenosylmethionine-8-amino-7-oxononanoate transaminase
MSGSHTLGLSLEQKDKKYLWHPFTQMQDWEAEDILIIESAEGVYLKDTHGRRYLDGVSSLWCNVHGHRIPELDQAVRDQLAKVAHSTFLGLSSVPAIELAEKLISISPAGLARVFYSDSGSEAVEIALKIAFQYWSHTGRPEKKEFVRLTHAYHGDTLGAVSVGGIDIFHEIFGPLLFKTHAAPAPYVYRWPGGGSREEVWDAALEAVEAIFKEHHSKIAAFLMEPLMQGAAGMIDQPQGYVRRVRELTKKYGILLIFDEVATGFGRTARMFACEHENAAPDILIAAKGLTGGYLPLAVTLVTEDIYRAFCGAYTELKTFFHGHTYTANPLACSAALANLKLFESRDVLGSLTSKMAVLEKKLQGFKALKHVGDIRRVGMMVGLELVRDLRTKAAYELSEKIGIRVIQRAREKGAILRPLGSVIVLMPPLGMNDAELETLLDITYSAIQEVTEAP